MKISIAIINDNADLYLKRYFESLKGWKESLDIVFVDNCSNDDSVQSASAFGLKKIVVPDKRKSSRAALYNTAIDKAENEYILFTHSDIILGVDFLDNLHRALAENTDVDFMNFQIKYVDTNVVGPDVLYWNFDGNKFKFYYKSIWGFPEKDFKYYISCTPSCFLINRKMIVDERFDERYLTDIFIYEKVFSLTFRGANVIDNNDSYIEHYYIERHEEIKAIKYDKPLFIKNNLLEIQLLQLADRDRQLVELNRGIIERDHQLADRDRKIDAFMRSWSWKITAPLRKIYSATLGH